MRPVWNNLGDPGLHLLAIALIMVYLAFGRGSGSGDDGADAPLPSCKTCHTHFMPGRQCDCRKASGIAHAWY